jgi:hypothetical protein
LFGASEVSGRERASEPLEAAGDPLDDETAVLIGRLLPCEVAGMQWVECQVLLESNFTMGCPIAATVIDASGDDHLRQEARALLDQWRDLVRAALVKFGAKDSTAEDDASVLLAALEGALILSRASQSTQPLDTVQRFFAASLTQAAGNPSAPAP